MPVAARAPRVVCEGATGSASPGGHDIRITRPVTERSCSSYRFRARLHRATARRVLAPLRHGRAEPDTSSLAKDHRPPCGAVEPGGQRTTGKTATHCSEGASKSTPSRAGARAATTGPHPHPAPPPPRARSAAAGCRPTPHNRPDHPGAPPGAGDPRPVPAAEPRRW